MDAHGENGLLMLSKGIPKCIQAILLNRTVICKSNFSRYIAYNSDEGGLRGQMTMGGFTLINWQEDNATRDTTVEKLEPVMQLLGCGVTRWWQGHNLASYWTIHPFSIDTAMCTCTVVTSFFSAHVTLINSQNTLSYCTLANPMWLRVWLWPWLSLPKLAGSVAEQRAVPLRQVRTGPHHTTLCTKHCVYLWVWAPSVSCATRGLRNAHWKKEGIHLRRVGNRNPVPN